ncbi:lipopolysaccharide transport periplasmic protein LptA [Legionella longbeachae]|uniref:OstA family protein n=1 Tax=Legionella longbeachae serogroup 1 (strain NSW150) TaxID=661367 RepID=D3HJ31_LEGLN|nr:lipopolysaccharide transport periplasmic protein LptA [Legionella longbeachae]VEE02919.1 OstA family protein [Legionella oakridgensis]HBD7398878.1 lipopolysaccharide transport periplasmic protein LptA [Legionella pneumophila]ARB90841.1 lipopolysaccharide transport periplasmic protein LptA [Legionella longbeachae]ARM32733.1 lipopolysaccharide transport periplasmic protein LptA [Legionella longbeachae]EEZ94482.1 cell envelope biogenesis protein YhbN [Legionella longbeachae D-4968]
MFQQMVRYSASHQYFKLWFCLWFFLTFACSSYALSEDKEKVMHVMADSADLSQQQHKGIYTGNVELIQGTTNLRATKAITLGNEKNQLVVAIASGAPGQQAHYWTTTDPKKPPLHAYADTIRYYPLRHLIELIGNARVEQGNNSFSATKISYDTEKQHVLSQGDGSKRIMIIYHPEKKPS